MPFEVRFLGCPSATSCWAILSQNFLSLLAKCRVLFTKTHITDWQGFKGNNFCCHSWICVSSPTYLSEECHRAKFILGVLWVFLIGRIVICFWDQRQVTCLPRTTQTAGNENHLCVLFLKKLLISLLGKCTYLKESTDHSFAGYTAGFVFTVMLLWCTWVNILCLQEKLLKMLLELLGSALPLLCACANIIYSYSDLHLLYV